jgi:hypothetical protein
MIIVRDEQPTKRSTTARRRHLIDPTQEYAGLRQELAQSSKFVFERPLAIVTIGAALVAANKDLGIVIPTLVVGLLLFNFTFTVNRVCSAARIASYIRVALEGNIRWIGWETSLGLYRTRWRDRLTCRHCADVLVDRKLATPAGALLYYYPIYWFHVVLVVACVIAGWAQWHTSEAGVSWIAVVPLTAISLLFAHFALGNGPKSASLLVEVNVLRWQSLLGPRSTGAELVESCPEPAGGALSRLLRWRPWRRML